MLENRIHNALRYRTDREEIVDSLEELRNEICRVFKVWEAYPTSISKFRIQGACDTKNDLYPLTHVDFEEDRFKSSLLANLEIRNG